MLGALPKGARTKSQGFPPLLCRWSRLAARGQGEEALAAHICMPLVGLMLLLNVSVFLPGCVPSGDNGQPTPPTAPSARVEQQAVQRLLDLYQQALLQEDIDRLQALFQPTDVHGQPAALHTQTPAAAPFADVQTFREGMTTAFRTRTLTALQIPAATIQVAADRHSVTFDEIESVEDPALLAQHTHVFRTTWQLSRVPTAVGGLAFHIRGVQREGPLVHIATWGQIQAGALTRLEVRPGTVAFTGGVIEVPETLAVVPLMADEDRFQSLFVSPTFPTPQPLHVRLQTSSGAELVVPHRYQVRAQREQVVQPVTVDSSDGSLRPSFFAVAVGPDSTVWAGGEATNSGTVGTIVQVAAAGRVLQQFAPLHAALPAEARAQIVDIAVDQRRRLHFLFLARTDAGVVSGGELVVDPQYPDLFCQTVNVFDATYPLRVQDPHSNRFLQSPSTRAVAAEGGNIWFFGSDGGGVQVADAFRGGQCPTAGVEVHYDLVVRRQASGLLSNTVPALVVGASGTLWFGTAVGLNRWQHGRWTAVPFDPALSVRGNVATLEAFFQAVAQALFEARPLATVRLGAVSFVEQFGSPLIKEDLIFSMVEDAHGRLWVGTLGGGLRCIEGDRQTRHLTRLDGLPSNMILALAVGPDGAIWAATDAGVSRLQEADGTVTITTFGALDGLELPVRDVAVDTAGTVWLATGGGLFRLMPQGGRVEGVVRDTLGRPIAGVDVVVQGTPFRAVTDAGGHFVLANIPPGQQHLMFDSRLATGGPFTTTVRPIEVTAGEQTRDMVRLTSTPQLTAQAGDGARVTVHTPLQLVVRVADRFGPVAGVPVTFRITAGNGSLAPGSVTTGPNGEAATTLTLGTAAGLNQVEARAAGLEPVVFTVTGAADRAMARLVAVSGNNQRGQPGAILPEPLVVRLEDQFGNPLVGQDVTAQIIEGEGAFVNRPMVHTQLRGQGTRRALVRGTTTRTEGTNAQGEAGFFLQVDATGTGIVVTEITAPALPQIEPVQFVTTVVLSLPVAIAVETDGALVVVDEALGAVVRVDPTTGILTLVSGLGRGSGPDFASPTAIAIEAAGTLVVTDNVRMAVVRVDPATGARGVISGCIEAVVRKESVTCTREVGRGPSFVTLLNIAVEAAGTLVVTDAGRDAVLRVDPATGDRRVVSGCTARDAATAACRGEIGRGPDFNVPIAMAVEATGTLVVTETSPGAAVIRVDPATGDRRVVSGCLDPQCTEQLGTGRRLHLPWGIAVEASGTLVVADYDSVLRVDPGTGDRKTVSGCAFSADCPQKIGSGPGLVNTSGIAVEAAGTLLVVDWPGAGVARVDPRTGNRTLVLERLTVGSGPPFGYTLLAIASERVQHTLVVMEPDTVMRVHPVTGDRRVVSGCERDPVTFACLNDIGSGPPLRDLRGIAVEATGALVVTDGSLNAVLRVDPATGDRRVVSGCAAQDLDTYACLRDIGSGPLFRYLRGIAVEATGALVVLDPDLVAVLRVDPATGDRRVVSRCAARDLDTYACLRDIGRGPPLGYPQDLAVEATGALVVADISGAVLRVDPRTGDRRVVSGCESDPVTLACLNDIGRGPPFSVGHSPTGIAVAADGTLLVLDNGMKAMLRVDPGTGNRTIVTGCVNGVCLEKIGSGQPLGFAEGIAIEADGTLMVVHNGIKAVLRVDPGTGNRSIGS